MKLIFNIKKTLYNAKSSFRRFPIAMYFSLLSAALFIIGNKSGQKNGYNNISTRYGFLFFMAMICFIFLGLFLEGLKTRAKDEEDLQKYKLIKLSSQILLLPILYGIKENMLSMEESLFSYNNSYKYFGLLLFLIISSFFIGKIFYHKDYIAYVIKVISAIFFSMLYSVVLFLGFVAIYSALTHLFGVRISSNVYLNTAIVIFIPFNFGILLSNFPKNETSLANFELTKAVQVLLSYILMPIFSVYLVILYLYFAKIVFIGEIPKNILIHLILWFSIFSVIYLFILGIIKNSKVINDFRKYFPILMLPIILLMFYAIFLRVRQYGITENRYFVIIAGIWVLVSMIYYVFYRSNSNRAIPILLSLTILISTIGPVSAYNISATSQNARLKKILLKNNMLNGTKIVPKVDVSDEDKAIISEIIRYMCRTHRGYEQKFVPIDFSCSDEDMKDVFGFDYSTSYDVYESLYYNYDSEVSIDVENYSKLLLIDSYSDPNDSKIVGNYKIKRNSNLIDIYINTENSKKELVTIDMTDVKNKLKVLKKSKEIIDPEELAITGKTDDIEYKIVFTSLSFYGDETNQDNYSCSFYLLTNRND